MSARPATQVSSRPRPRRRVSVTGPAALMRLAPGLRSVVHETLAAERALYGPIGVRLAADDELRMLNRRWRGIDRATDVLAFPYSDRDLEGWVSGDLVISLERALAQARRYRVTLGRELARLVVHGTLHLAGHDHHRTEERRRMRRAESRALREAKRAIHALDVLWGRDARVAASMTPRRPRRSR